MSTVTKRAYLKVFAGGIHETYKNVSRRPHRVCCVDWAVN